MQLSELLFFLYTKPIVKMHNIAKMRMICLFLYILSKSSSKIMFLFQTQTIQNIFLIIVQLSN